MWSELTKVRLTNLNKLMFPILQITKFNVVEYYIRIGPEMLVFLSGRALVTNRFPDGVDKEGFYEKDAPKSTPSWVKTVKRFSETAGREINYLVCNKIDTLIWLANLAAIEIHIKLSRIESEEVPDLVLFDIDPEPPAGFPEAAEVSLLLKEKLDHLGLRSYVKTSGKKGLHIVIPVITKYNYKQTREFVHEFGRYMSRESELTVSEFSQSRKAGTVFIDYPQNSSGKTMICPYSLRAEKGATVSAPVEWRELEEEIKPEDLNIFTVLERTSSPWEDIWDNRQKLEVK